MTLSRSRAWVGLGANLGERFTTLRSAIAMIEATVADTALIAASDVYETRPIGPSREPFLNAVAEFSTGLEPRSLLAELHRIEAAHFRQRRVQWEARTLDLDLIAYLPHDRSDFWRENDGDLVQPHPRAHLRDFVLRPLVELGVTTALWDGRSAAELLAEIPASESTIIRRWPDALAPRLAASHPR